MTELKTVLFQSRTGASSHLDRTQRCPGSPLYPRFQSRTGASSHLDSYPHNTASEAKKAILSREPQKKRYFLAEKSKIFLVIFPSIPFSRLPRTSVWRVHHCGSRKPQQPVLPRRTRFRGGVETAILLIASWLVVSIIKES